MNGALSLFDNPASGSLPRARVRAAARTSWLVQLGLVFAFVHSFDLLSSSPLRPYFWRFDFIILAALALFAVLFATSRLLRHGWHLSGLDICVLLIAGVMPFYTAWRAHSVFGQPLVFGVLSERDLLQGLYAWLLLYLFWKRAIRLRDVERVVLAMCWVSLVAIYLVGLARASGWNPEPIIEGTDKRFGKDNFNVILLVFGGLYYAARYARQGRGADALAALAILGTVVFYREGRSINLAVLIALGWLALRTMSGTRKAKLAVVSGTLAVLVGLYVAQSAEASAFFQGLVGFYGAAVGTLFGDVGDDLSANARIYQFAVMWPYITEYALWGAGQLSHQWNGGFARLFGELHPSDLGMLGMVFVYGIVGVLIFSAQVLLAARLGREVSDRQSPVFVVTCKYYLVFLYVVSIPTARFIFSVGTTLIILTLLYAHVHGLDRSLGARVGRR
ncbi:MAG: hypothetical protein AAFN13_00440 [Bacteroidota bacterium]